MKRITGATQNTPGLSGTEDIDIGKGSFGKGGSGYIEYSGIYSGGGAGLFGGGSGYLSGGGGSGYVNTTYLKNAKTVTSKHVGDGDCKIMLLSK